ncbi:MULTISPECIES: DUF1016 N-terminal domain-containing protein [Flavobacteriaceae]|uniref:DUF1016 N-terminal domain-containing protein n=1 Tax=Flavobacteriaceae TaxID=49546 RepID=UPI00054FFA66|nr:MULTISPECIES: DUF1016 N-terminal domain-containing protein [Flavobacteriaceae]
MKNGLHNNLVKELSQLIEQGKHQIAVQVNSTMTLVFWEVGKRINKEILQYVRADYGKNIVTTVSSQLKKRYGNSFGTSNKKTGIKINTAMVAARERIAQKKLQ